MDVPDFVPYMEVKDVREVLGELVGFFLGDSYLISELVAGEPVTVFVRDGVVGVSDTTGTYPAGFGSPASEWFTATETYSRLTEFEAHVKKSFVLQGYMIGPSYEGNPYELEVDEFVVSNILDLEERFQLTPQEVHWFLKTYNDSPAVKEKLGLVPNTVYETPFAPAARLIAMSGGEPATIQAVSQDVLTDLNLLAGGMSSMNPTKDRKGLVFRSMRTDFVFKIEKEDK